MGWWIMRPESNNIDLQKGYTSHTALDEVPSQTAFRKIHQYHVMGIDTIEDLPVE